MFDVIMLLSTKPTEPCQKWCHHITWWACLNNQEYNALRESQCQVLRIFAQENTSCASGKRCCKFFWLQNTLNLYRLLFLWGFKAALGRIWVRNARTCLYSITLPHLISCSLQTRGYFLFIYFVSGVYWYAWIVCFFAIVGICLTLLLMSSSYF